MVASWEATIVVSEQDMRHHRYRRSTAVAHGIAGKAGWHWLYRLPAWTAYSKQYRAEHPTCVRCEQAGRVTASKVVDHIRPHRGDLELFWDPANHQALCKRCHDAKTAREDGGGGKNLKTDC